MRLVNISHLGMSVVLMTGFVSACAPADQNNPGPAQGTDVTQGGTVVDEDALLEVLPDSTAGADSVDLADLPIDQLGSLPPTALPPSLAIEVRPSHVTFSPSAFLVLACSDEGVATSLWRLSESQWTPAGDSGCVGGESGFRLEAGGTYALVPTADGVASRVDASGGFLESAYASVRIPEGALDHRAFVALAKLEDGLDGTGSGYSLAPHGLTFAKPVTLELPCEGDSQVEILRKPTPSFDRWFGHSIVGCEGGRATVQVDRFSWYAVTELPKSEPISETVPAPVVPQYRPQYDAALVDSALVNGRYGTSGQDQGIALVRAMLEANKKVYYRIASVDGISADQESSVRASVGATEENLRVLEHEGIGSGGRSVWIRDWGPYSHSDGSLSAFPYAGDATSVAGNELIAAKLKKPFRKGSLRALEGGNFSIDGTRRCFVSERVAQANGVAETRRQLKAVLGCETTIIVPRLAGEPTGHIDLFMKQLSDEAVAVNRPDPQALSEWQTEAKSFTEETHGQLEEYESRGTGTQTPSSRLPFESAGLREQGTKMVRGDDWLAGDAEMRLEAIEKGVDLAARQSRYLDDLARALETGQMDLLIPHFQSEKVRAAVDNPSIRLQVERLDMPIYLSLEPRLFADRSNRIYSRSYSNTLFLSGAAFVPQFVAFSDYDNARYQDENRLAGYEATARNVYGKYGFETVLLPFDSIMRYQGAIHCVTKEMQWGCPEGETWDEEANQCGTGASTSCFGTDSCTDGKVCSWNGAETGYCCKDPYVPGEGERTCFNDGECEAEGKVCGYAGPDTNRYYCVVPEPTCG